MFGFSYTKILVVIAVLAIIAGGYLYVTNLQTKNAELTASLATAQLANKTLTEEKNDIIRRLEVSKFEQDKLNNSLNESREKYNATVKIFSDHDFEKLAKSKPGLISNRMKAATKKVFDEVEKESNKK